MKNFLKIFLIVGFGTIISACTDPEESFNWNPGENLRISGSSEISTLTTASYYVQGFTIAEDYNWSLTGPSGEVTVRRDGEFADVFVEAPGTYTLTVSNGTYNGSMTIEAASVDQALGFETDSIRTTESLTDTLFIPVVITERNPEGATVSFSIDASSTATMGENDDFVILTDSPLIFDEETTKHIEVLVRSDGEREATAETIVINLNAITDTGLGEYAVTLGDETEITVYIDDDLKVLSFESMENDTLTSSSDAGNYVYNVVLSGASESEVTVPYTISGTGVTPQIGSLTFTAGTISQPLPLTLSDAAFATDQEIVISLGEPVSDDEEVIIERDEEDNLIGHEKIIIIEIE